VSIADAAAANATAVKAALGPQADTFTELGPKATSLSEGSWSANAIFPAGAKWNIGLPVAPNGASLPDLVLQYHTTDETPGDAFEGVVVIVTSEVAVDPLSTWDTRPALSGTVNNPTADIRVTVGGHTYAATNNGDGTWTLADNVITSPLAYGTLNVSVSARMGTTTVAQDSTTNELTIVNSPVVSIVKTKDAAETVPGAAATNGLFTVTRVGGDLAASLDVQYSVGAGSTATAGDDYAALTGTVTFLAGQKSATIPVAVQDDLIAEGTETVIVNLTPSLVYHSTAGTDTATLSIADNEPVVSITALNATASETGPTPGSFQISRTGSTASDLTVYYTITGTAANGTDYVSIAASATIDATKSTVNVTITPYDDTIIEVGNETVILTLTARTNYAVLSTAKTATIPLSFTAT
ncbi:MAG: hypothetical protein NTV86_16715, partial [Planctomycetota bacterium]|nr:hypothetical protein [Planctomycetota bacterium]